VLIFREGGETSPFQKTGVNIMKMHTQTKKLTVIAMLSALAYLVMVFGRIPIVQFLKYDPKDVIITISGFLYGPLTSFIISVIVSLIEMVTVSDTGFIGLVMNIISSCAFACTAAVIYKNMHTLKGAVIGLITGWLVTTAVMILWNYFVVPIYMDVPREMVAAMLIPVFLPFNLLKGGLNAAITMLIYKPVSIALHKSSFIETENNNAGTGKINIGLMMAAVFVLISCILFAMVLQGKI